MKNEILNDWIFRLNPYNNKWLTAKRENYHDLMNNINSNKVISSSSVDTLTDLIIRTGGNIKEMHKIAC